MSECLNNKDVKTNARFVAGILFKNTVLNTSRDEELNRLWYKMSEEERDTMKTSLFKALVCNNKNVMRSAGFAISAVAVLEIPNGQSLDIIDFLYENSRHHLDNIREVSLSTFKYICEDISSKDLQKEQADLIVNTCVKLLKENSANSKNLPCIICGLYYSIKFMVKHFEDGYGGVIMEVIYEAIKHDDVQIRNITLQCIGEIIRFYYDYIKPFMPGITQVTFNLAQNDVAKVKIQVFEVWASIAEQELFRLQRGINIHNIIEKTLDDLLKILVLGFQEFDFGNFDDGELKFGSSVSAGWCLGLVSQVVKDLVVHPIAEFAAQNLAEENWECRCCALISLRPIIKGPSKQCLMETFEPSISQMAELINDENNCVRFSACLLFSEIAKDCHELLIEEKVFKEVLYKNLMQGLQSEPRVASIIYELSKSTLDLEERPETCFLSVCFDELIEGLCQMTKCDTMSTPKLSKTRETGFAALLNLLVYAPRDCENYCKGFLFKAIGKLQHSLKVKPDISNLELQGNLLSAVECILTNMEIEISDKVGEEILDLIINIFDQRSGVCDKGYLILSVLCNKHCHVIKAKVDSCAPYIMQGIKSKDPLIIKCSCGVLSDLCMLVEPEGFIEENLPEYMPILIDHLRDPKIDRKTKKTIITVIGDIFSLVKHKFKDFIEEALSILEIVSKSAITEYKETIKQDKQACLSGNLQSSKEYEIEDLQDMIQMQEALIECYTCFSQNIIYTFDDSMYQTLGQYIDSIIDFLLVCSSGEFQPYNQTIKDIGICIYDVACTYGQDPDIVLHFSLKNNRLADLINRLEGLDSEAQNIRDSIIEEINMLND